MKKARNAVPIRVFGRFCVLLFVTSEWHTTAEWKKLVEKEKKAVKRNTFFWFSTFCSFWQSTAIMRYVKAKNSQIGGKKVQSFKITHRFSTAVENCVENLCHRVEN